MSEIAFPITAERIQDFIRQAKASGKLECVVEHKTDSPIAWVIYEAESREIAYVEFQQIVFEIIEKEIQIKTIERLTQ